MKAKKGFTLTELIIVIAVIAILAAVLIPSIVGYVKKAKVSSDTSDARNMNTLLLEYFGGEIPSNLEAPDIRYAIWQSDSRYSFIPKSSSDGYSFWYNTNSKKIILSKAEDLVTKGAQAADTITSIEEIIEGFILLDASGSELADVLTSLRSITGLSEYNEIYNAFTKENGNSTSLLDSLKGYTDEQIAGLSNHIALFNPNNTLYINDFTSFTTSSGIVTNIVFANNILSIPANASQNITTVNGVIRLPESVQFVEPGAFVTITSADDFIISNISSIRIAKSEDPNSLDNSFSKELVALLGSQVDNFLEMRSDPIASIETLLNYDESEKVINSNLEYIPYNLSISPHVTITEAVDGYEMGEKVFIDKWRVKYTSNTNGTITMNIKMFDDIGIIASKTIVYREINDINIDLDGATLTFDNVARLIYNDEADAIDSANNYQYKIYIGDDLTNVSIYEASDISGTIGSKDLGISEGAYSNLVDAQSKINELYEMSNTTGRYYTKEPQIIKNSDLWQLSYAFKTSGNSDTDGILQNSQKKDTASGSEVTREDLYEIRIDESINGEEKYYITKTSTESGLTYEETNVYYYAHDDKNDINKYDGLSNTFQGTQYLTTNIYDKIESSSLANYQSQIDADGNLKVTIVLCDQEGTEIIKKSEKFPVSTSNRVYHENVTNGQSQQFLYKFVNIPSYYNLNTNILELYDDIFTKKFVYKGKRQPINGETNVDYDINPGDDGYGYGAYDEIYDLNNPNSIGYQNLIKKLQELINVGKVPTFGNQTVEEILNNAYFIKNTAPDEKMGSIEMKPSIYDPYFLLIGLDTHTTGEKDMILIGIFDQLAVDESSSATSRIIEFKYRVAESDLLEVTKINGRELYGTGTTPDNPFFIYEEEVGNNIFLNGLSQLRIINNSIVSLSKTSSDTTLPENYKIEWKESTIPDIYELKISYWPNYVSYYNETIIYCKKMDDNVQEVDISSINDRDATLTDSFTFYEGEALGITSIPSNYVIGNNIPSINLLAINSNTNTAIIYQTIVTVDKGNNEVDKYYFIRGDKLPTSDIDLSNLKGLTKVGKIEDCKPNTNMNSNNYYYCIDYYYQFVKDGKTYIYYPYAIYTPNLEDTSSRYIIPNPLQYLVIIQKFDGTYEFELFDTNSSVGTSTAGVLSYISNPKTELNYWIDLNLTSGEHGTISFDTYRYYYFRADSLYVTPDKYYYAGKDFENWILYDHFRDSKQFEVVSTMGIENNVHSMLINGSTITWNGGADGASIGSILFDADELIQSKNRTYIQLAYPNQLSVQTIYASNNKNKYYIEMFLDEISAANKITFDDNQVFADKKNGIIIVKVYWYGIELEYEFKYAVLDSLALQLDYVLNDKNYNQVFEIEADQKLISSTTDSYTMLHLYDKFIPLTSIRDIRISDNGVEMQIKDKEGNIIVENVPKISPFMSVSELGCEIGKNYIATITYAKLETSFEFTVVGEKEIYDARLYYINGRSINNRTSSSTQDFYFLKDENLKVIYGYELDGFTNNYKNGYVNNYWLSAYIYPTYTSSQLIDLSAILGEYNSNTNTFTNVHFYLDSKEYEITFKQENFAHVEYVDTDYTEGEEEYAYYYRISDTSLSNHTKLIIEFTYEGKIYQAEMLYNVVDYYIDYINNDSTSIYLAPEIQKEGMVTSNQTITFNSSDSLLFGTSNYSEGYTEVNRWRVRSIIQKEFKNGYLTGSYEEKDFNGKTIYYSKSTSSIPVPMSTYNFYYESQLKALFSKIYIEGFDASGQNIVSEVIYENSQKTKFDFIDYPNMMGGKIYFVYIDGSTHYYEFVLREDLNDVDMENAQFIRVNNYYLDNYDNNNIPNYSIMEGEQIVINSSATQLLLPSLNGITHTTISAPTGSKTNVIGSSLSLYFLSKVSSGEIQQTDYIRVENEEGQEKLIFDETKWTFLNTEYITNPQTNAYEINVWDCWPSDADDAILTLVYRYGDGNIYILNLKLIKSDSSIFDIGIRKINNVNYYPDLTSANKDIEIVLDVNNLNITLSQSSLYYTYNATYKTTTALNTTSSYSYSLNGNEWIPLVVENGQIILPADIFVNGAKGQIKIDGFKLNNVVYDNIVFNFVVSQYSGNITKLNNMLINQDGIAYVFRNEKIATTSASVFNYFATKQTTTSFREYIQGTTTSAYFYYYFEIMGGLANENIQIVEDNEQLTYYYNWNGYDCEVIEDNGTYFYLIPNTEIWSFEEDGKFRIVYKPTPSGALAYVAYLDIKVMDKESSSKEVLNSLYYDLLDNNLVIVSGYKALKTASLNTDTGNTWDNPLVISRHNITSGEELYQMVIPVSSNTSFKYYRANGNVETIYANNANLKAMLYDVSNDGELLNGKEFIIGQTSLYNGEEFDNTRYEEDFGEVYYTNTKALVLSYELYGIEYTVVFYYYFSSK